MHSKTDRTKLSPWVLLVILVCGSVISPLYSRNHKNSQDPPKDPSPPVDMSTQPLRGNEKDNPIDYLGHQSFRGDLMNLTLRYSF